MLPKRKGEATTVSSLTNRVGRTLIHTDGKRKKAHDHPCQTRTITSSLHRAVIDLDNHIRSPPSLTTRQCFSRSRVVASKPHRESRKIVAIGKPGTQFGVSQSLLLGFLRIFGSGALSRQDISACAIGSYGPLEVLTYLLRVCLGGRTTRLRLVGFRRLGVGLRHCRSMKGICVGGGR